MPELPEVQALAADLDARLRGRTISRLQVLAFPALKTYDPAVESLAGERIAGVLRHGKFVDIACDGGLHLVMHLARAGWVRWRAGEPKTSGRPGSGPLAARLVLDDGSGFDVTEAGTKKSLALYMVRDPSEVPGIARLGPDPLDAAFTLERFRGILRAAGRAQLKGVLRDQSVIAGIGNAYSDEILHLARMSPYKPAAMDDDDSAALYAALRTTLAEAVARADGVSASELKAEKKTHLRVHGRFGEPCPVCGTRIEQVIFADRTFQYCPGCQTGGRKLSDRVLDRLLR
ncbi:Fpg/Nei family DNA glycosylase [Protaetiibacter mangrovi]|uniref:Fpg/Nei family DNA glycosylase n=1 Tax=Protaetiibacter mangrovi TaxID=2970926 RepID=A0ABT1ZJ68_9MICO|nr:DNA-formamidopyrimidine glycosylase family protein [Protaetiibacter mangrovi]MCS0500751.1 Fpg/Nei family DNA glycosylase [Protaetiibacter mangrovi]TPX05541.1 Fpg/Nei family DNA glycosylase [Schumannella luteola]